MSGAARVPPDARRSAAGAAYHAAQLLRRTLSVVDSFLGTCSRAAPARVRRGAEAEGEGEGVYGAACPSLRDGDSWCCVGRGRSGTTGILQDDRWHRSRAALGMLLVATTSTSVSPHALLHLHPCHLTRPPSGSLDGG